ncbi:uncharacterized protein LOC119735673 [Patiria miniata]|uniref:Uncharacterized protein n=1 Tax=Patiria miniata TaxID=46514 RepID=A0A914ANT6_PATMI|nr:uncharacterized protein LOC119735673 [Patiria miniata]
MKALQYVMLFFSGFCHVTSASSDSSHVYLQRGKPGEIPNPHVTGNSTNLEKISSAYWYKLTSEGKPLLISNFEGSIIPRTKYIKRFNMTENFSLIINNVTDRDGGQYISRVVKKNQVLPESSVDVTIFVSPSEPAPWIEECGVPKDRKDYCMMQLPSEETFFYLMCHVTGARPAVDLHLRRVHADGSSEAVDQVLHIVRREDSSQYGAIGKDKALFSTMLYFNGTFHGNTTLLCIATGLAMGRNNGSAMQVHISKPLDDTHVPSTARWITEVEGTGRLVLEGISIAALCAFAVGLLLMLVLKKTVCRMERFQQAVPREQQPFLLNDPTTKCGIPKPQMDSLKENIGKVAYVGLTDPQAERRVFSPDEFPNPTLEIGVGLGILCKETRTSEGRTVPTVKFLHLFQEYYAAYYLSTDPATLLPQVCGETIPRNEHLLRFCREMSDEAARIIDELHQQG